MGTRYPKVKGVEVKGAKWTVKGLEAITPEAKGETLGDGEGLSGEVRVTQDGKVSVKWDYAFKWQGKVKWHYCGTWPAVSLDDVRRERDAAREKVRNGVNPIDAKKAGRIEAQLKVEATIAEATRAKASELTVRELYVDWLARGVNRKDGNAALKQAMERDILPTLGERPLRLVLDKDIHEALAAILQRRAEKGSKKQPGHRTADMTLKLVQQMFSWADKRQPYRALLVAGNPAAVVELDKVLPRGARPNAPRKRWLSDDEVRELWDRFPALRRRWEEAHDRRSARRPMHPRTEIAVWLCLSTLTRIGALMLAEWKHVDEDGSRQWFIPKENQKETQAEPQDLVIELSDFACGWFHRLRALTGGGNWCFPNAAGNGPLGKTITKQIGDRQMMFSECATKKGRSMTNDLVLAEGKTGQWTPHDLRRTGATMMQALGVDRVVINRCQGHVTDAEATQRERNMDKIDRHYLQHPYRDEMRDAFDRLGKSLEAVVAPRLVRKAA